MSLSWPWALLGLLALPVLVVLRRRLLARQAARRAGLARDGLVLTAPRADRWSRVVPALLFAALAVLVVALSRPVADVSTPRREGTVVLAFDVSTSMGATDLKPSRLEAAKTAAKAFVGRQPASVNLAVVAFGGTGVMTQRPTTDRTAVIAAINRLTPQGDTSLGRGILGALSAIVGKQVKAPGDAETGTDSETPIGYHGGTAIVLLTDGEDTGRPRPGGRGPAGVVRRRPHRADRARHRGRFDPPGRRLQHRHRPG